MQSRCALPHAYAPPFAAQSPPSSIYSFVYLRGIGFGNLCDDGPVGGIQIRELPLTRDEAPIDVILNMLHEISPLKNRSSARGREANSHVGERRTHFHVTSQGVAPGGHFNAKGAQTGRRQNRICRTRRGTGHFLAADRLHFGGKSRTLNDLLCELKPAAIAGIGRVKNAAGTSSRKLNDRLCQIFRVGGAPALIIYNFKRGTTRGEFQDSVWKAFAAGAKEPRSTNDADVGIDI